MFLAQAYAFVKALLGKRDPRLATAEDGIKALAICDAARRASDRRCEESVEYPFDKAQDRP
jgi:predicted dehydrogenase